MITNIIWEVVLLQHIAAYIQVCLLSTSIIIIIWWLEGGVPSCIRLSCNSNAVVVDILMFSIVDIPNNGSTIDLPNG